MALNLQLHLKQSQQLAMTPQIRLSMKLLQFSRMELEAMVSRELELNPALEEGFGDISGEEPAPEETLSPDREVVIEEKINDDIDWSAYVREYNSTGIMETERPEPFNAEMNINAGQSLTDFLLRQLSMAFPDDEDRAVGTHIIGNLNPEGYLESGAADIAETLGKAPEKVREILSVMQTFDPLGVCARNLGECLLIQAAELDFKNAPVQKELVEAVIRGHLKDIQNRNIPAIERKLGAKPRDITAAIDLIKSLDPKPGLTFLNEPPQYIVPDIFVHKEKDRFIISVNDDGMPRLKISKFYRDAVTGGKKMDQEARKYVRENLDSAAWLIKGIHQRRNTIHKIMESILKFQGDFFDHGVKKLKPLLLSDVAEDIRMHPSTVSRATTHKYVHTPRGVFELKFFFNKSLKSSNGETVSPASVQNKIAEIVKKEDKKKPLSDEQISLLLKKDHVFLARRTVGKYRDMLKILPSSKRRQL
ncbi:RNA polymerase sigma-54 factor [Candidatus Desulfarcum epimagneticum]|uniref:RNA polymerase sigma-54 factor n=1 Tax=uncultured Desulfobacteraceae bacterium TaxID=218296 RepID=A0A484HIV8_9BACT|nr:RNA polymerase sigma-54 factor [uncultured Desulfobacteraceae bacterium]